MKLLPISFGLAAFLLAGCGGSGGSNPAPRTANLQIDWAARSRAVTGPSSALSARVTLSAAAPNGGDLTLVVDRHADPAAYSQTYTVGQAKTGPHTLTVRFYAGANGTGDVVAVASGTLNSDNSTTVTTTQSVKTVSVNAGQDVNTGDTEELMFAARAEGGALVAVSPGSASWSLVSGGEFLHLDEDGDAAGMARGVAQVRVTVDGVVSEPENVNVNADPDGDAILIDFDDLTGVFPVAGTEVPEASRLSDQYRSVHGISFSSTSQYVSVVQLGSDAAPSGENSIGGSTADGRVTYGRNNPMVFTFFDPLKTESNGATRTFSLTTDKVGKPGNFVRLEAYDSAGTLIGFDETEDLGNDTLTISFDTAQIHRVVFLGSPDDNDGVAVDNVTFGPVVPAPVIMN